MYLRNTLQSYGLISILLHWIMAIIIIALFAIGKYMVNLNYYDPWYQAAPNLHRSIGVIIGLLLVFRLGWRLSNPHPKMIAQRWEQLIAVWIQRIFYILILAIIISGYLITTADGQVVSVFNWFDVPAVFEAYENQEDIAGEIHEWLSNLLFMLVVLHLLAALKHHFFNHDATLLRMLGIGRQSKQ
ncbi:MAG: cytochrome b [Pseudomonadota bacterium]